MALLDKIQEFETRPAAFNSAEQSSRTSMFRHLSAINKFEGITPTAVDERLFQLLAAGKVTKQEYLELCLLDAHGTA